MHAVGYKQPGNIDADGSLIDIDLPEQTPSAHDILVEVKAVSVNPVDTKVRASAKPDQGEFKVLGWDAAGIVKEVGPEVSRFKPGDEVYYAGALNRSGTNSQYHVVDARIVGRKPATLDWAGAAALPLTAITAWEALFDRLDIRRPVAGGAQAILIVGGAGGVGSIAIQLARRLTDLTVITTASRQETVDWVNQMGAHHVLDHQQGLAQQVAALKLGKPSFVFSTTHTASHVLEVSELISPQGRFALIDDPMTLDIVPFKSKSVSVHWEFMFTRSLFQTADLANQGKLLDEVATMIEEGKLRTTLTERLTPINAKNLRTVHKKIETNTARGKIVLEGWH